MRYRLIKEEPVTLAYRNGQIYFRTIMMDDGYWHWLAIHSRPPGHRREREINGPHLTLLWTSGLSEIWRIKKEGFQVRSQAAEKIIARLVREGYAETL